MQAHATSPVPYDVKWLARRLSLLAVAITVAGLSIGCMRRPYSGIIRDKGHDPERWENVPGVMCNGPVCTETSTPVFIAEHWWFLIERDDGATPSKCHVDRRTFDTYRWGERVTCGKKP